MSKRSCSEYDAVGLICRAAHYASVRHRDQQRKDGRTPYITHPIALAATLSAAGVRDPNVVAAALMHDLIEDTPTTYDDVRGEFGETIADIVLEVTDTKFLSKRTRKRLQLAKAGRNSEEAKLIKLADKICNLRDMLARPPGGWSVGRKQEYFDWASKVIDGVRGTNAYLERMFDRLVRQRPAEPSRLPQQRRS